MKLRKAFFNHIINELINLSEEHFSIIDRFPYSLPLILTSHVCHACTSAVLLVNFLKYIRYSLYLKIAYLIDKNSITKVFFLLTYVALLPLLLNIFFSQTIFLTYVALLPLLLNIFLCQTIKSHFLR